MERQAAGPPTEEIIDIGMLKALAHPRRQAIMQRLSVHGPATSATLARDLGWNTGATSYHLRELAKYGLVEELPDRAHGRERWWRQIPRDLRFPRRSQQTPDVRAIVDEMNRLGFTADLEAFARTQAEADLDGGWGDAFPYSRGTVRVNLEELMEFFEEYIGLVTRYQRPAEDAPADSRLVLTRFFAYPAPLADADAGRTRDQDR